MKASNVSRREALRQIAALAGLTTATTHAGLLAYYTSFFLPEEARASEDEFVTDIVNTTLKELQTKGSKLNDLDRPPKTKKKYYRAKVEYPEGAIKITSNFKSMTNVAGVTRKRVHKGIDMHTSRGTPVIAAAKGKARTGRYPSGGNFVTIEHDMPTRYAKPLSKNESAALRYTIRTTYIHLDEILVPADKPSVYVDRGEVIGTVGDTGTGAGTGPSLHFEVAVVNIYGGYTLLYGKVNPHYFWAEGIGKITCYDPNANYPTDVTILTWPLKCK